MTTDQEEFEKEELRKELVKHAADSYENSIKKILEEAAPELADIPEMEILTDLLPFTMLLFMGPMIQEQSPETKAGYDAVSKELFNRHMFKTISVVEKLVDSIDVESLEREWGEVEEAT